jgi:hypothetical protein
MTRQGILREAGVLTKQNKRYLEKLHGNVEELTEAKKYEDARWYLQCQMTSRLLFALQQDNTEKIKALLAQCDMLAKSS